MSQLKISYKIVIVNIALAVILSLLIAASNSGDSMNYAFTFGSVSLVGGAVDVVIGILLVFFAKEWGKGFLLSGAALLLLGGITCGGALAIA